MHGGHVTRQVKTDMERVIMVAAKEGTNDAQVGPHCPLPGATGRRPQGGGPREGAV